MRPASALKTSTFELKTAVDFVVVGGGGAGAVVAKELSTAGFQVVVLEQGPYLHPDEFVHDELRFKDPSNPLAPEVLTNDHALQPNTFRRSANEKAVRQPTIGYGRCIGGVRSTSPPITGGSMKLISSSAAAGDRSLVPAFLIGPLLMQTWNGTIRRQNGNWASRGKPEPVRLIPHDPNPIRSLRCR